MKKWIAGAVVTVGVVVFGGAAIAQDATQQDPKKSHSVRLADDRAVDHEGCRFGQDGPDGDAA